MRVLIVEPTSIVVGPSRIDVLLTDVDSGCTLGTSQRTHRFEPNFGYPASAPPLQKKKFVLESLRFSPANYATSASIAGYARTLDYAGISESRQPWTDNVRAALPRSKDRGHESPSRPKSREHLNAGPPPGGSLELGSIYGIQAL